MTVDIFQYSNMYTLRKNVQWLADESHVEDECGPYVTKPGSYITLGNCLTHFWSRKGGARLAETSAPLFEAEVRKNSNGLDRELQCS
jgi:hypothetical protein